MDCGCTLGLGEFDEEAQLEDVEKWLKERGYVLTRFHQGKFGELAKPGAVQAH